MVIPPANYKKYDSEIQKSVRQSFIQSLSILAAKSIGDRSMRKEDRSAAAGLPLTSRLRLDQICTDFEKAWLNGSQPALSKYIVGVSESDRLAFVRELILLDAYHRRARGLACRVDDYLAAIQDLDPKWVSQILEEPQAKGEETRSFVTIPRTKDETPPDPAVSYPTDQLQEKVMLGDYELREEIGRGGMGIVYKAWHRSLSRWEAVKTGSWAPPTARTASDLLPDAEAMARLDHPNIVPVYGVGLENGRSYLSMKLLTGHSLKERLVDGPIASRAAAELILTLAGAIQHAHERGVFHLDLKPSNILFDEEGRAYVADFGLAKFFQPEEAERSASQAAGTPSYMAPEQTTTGPVGVLTPRTDVYGLGAVMYAVLTGRPPFQTDNVMATLRQVVAAQPVPPDWLNPQVDRDLAAICLKCLEKNPADRYANAADLAADLDCYLRGEYRLRARRIGLVERFSRSLLRHQFTDVRPWGWLVLMDGAVGGLTYLGYGWATYTEQSPKAFFLIGGANLGLLAPIFWYCVLRRWRTLGAGDRFALTMVAGMSLSLISLPVLLRPESGDDLMTYRLSLYPITALLYGLGHLPFCIYWNGYLLFAASYYVAAVIMRLTPFWAPLEFAGLYMVSHAVLGVVLLRFAASMDREQMSSTNSIE